MRTLVQALRLIIIRAGHDIMTIESVTLCSATKSKNFHGGSSYS